MKICLTALVLMYYFYFQVFMSDKDTWQRQRDTYIFDQLMFHYSVFR